MRVPTARASRKAGGPMAEPMPFVIILKGSGYELMHPEAYMDRLASTNQVSDLRNTIRGLFSSIFLTLLSGSA